MIKAEAVTPSDTADETAYQQIATNYWKQILCSS